MVDKDFLDAALDFRWKGMHQPWPSPLLNSGRAAESDEEAVRMEVPETACQGPLQWSAGEEEKLARLVALYADLPQETTEEDTHTSVEDELHVLLSQRTVAIASPLPRC